MSIEQLTDLLNYIKKNNCWGNGMMDVIHNRHRKAIKYVNTTFDSRDGTVFVVTFRSVVGGKEDEKFFRVDTNRDLANIYQWLDEEVVR